MTSLHSRGTLVRISKQIVLVLLLTLTLLLSIPTNSSAVTNAQTRKVRSPRTPALTRVEMKEANARLAEMGYGAGRTAVIAFQKYEARKVTGQLSREDIAAIMTATTPQAKDPGYKHVAVDLDRQVLLLTDDS